jgi:hypothetical protein
VTTGDARTPKKLELHRTKPHHTLKFIKDVSMAALYCWCCCGSGSGAGVSTTVPTCMRMTGMDTGMDMGMDAGSATVIGTRVSRASAIDAPIPASVAITGPTPL